MSSEKNIRDLSRCFSAHLYRAGSFGYIWLAPVGCHLNVGILNLAYKYPLRADEALAAKAADLFVRKRRVFAIIVDGCKRLHGLIVRGFSAAGREQHGLCLAVAGDDQRKAMPLFA